MPTLSASSSRSRRIVARSIRKLQIQRRQINTLHHPHIDTRHAREEIRVVRPRHAARATRTAEVVVHSLRGERVRLLHTLGVVSILHS